MCIIQGDPRRVSDTQLLAYRTRDGASQVTVYSNRVDLPQESPDGGDGGVWAAFGLALPASGGKHAAMILPVPLGAQRFDMIDVSRHPELFKDVDACFPEPQTRGYGLGDTLSAASASAPMLQVKSCGSYDYSLVPTLADFQRLDRSVFVLDADVRQVLGKHYGPEFAFLVCKLRARQKYHPVAYKHPMPADGKLFVPTLHYHQGHTNEAMAPDWDHQIYLVTPQPVGTAASNTTALRQLGPLHRLMPAVSPGHFRKLELRGHFSNQDLRIPV